MTGKRVATTILLLDLLAVVVCFLVTLVQFSADRVVPILAFRWEIAESLLTAFAILPVLQFLGIAITLGSSTGSSAEELVFSSFFPAAVISALLAAATLAASPFLAAQRSVVLETSAEFNDSLSGARSALAAGEIAAARLAIARCEIISRKDPRVIDLADRIAVAALKARENAEQPEGPEAPAPLPDPLVARDYYLKALEFEDKGDFFSAHWYASAALKLDPTHDDARRLAATAWERLSGTGENPADLERSAYYAEKLEGYSLLRSEDPVGAYRVFKMLAEDHSTDPDVARYLAQSLSATEKAAFFRDESDAAFAAGIVGDFFIRAPGSEDRDRLLAAKSVAISGEALYLRELEYVAIGKGGEHSIVRAPYGKLAGGALFLVCVERERPETIFRPTWERPEKSAPTSMLSLDLDSRTAYRLARARSSPSALSLLEAWKTAGEARSFGVDPSALVMDLLKRTTVPFSLFTASALGALVGARFRRRSSSFHRALFALVPLMAAAATPLFALVGRLDALVSAWAARAAPGLTAIGLGRNTNRSPVPGGPPDRRVQGRAGAGPQDLIALARFIGPRRARSGRRGYEAVRRGARNPSRSDRHCG
jgi:hypothetical protein